MPTPSSPYQFTYVTDVSVTTPPGGLVISRRALGGGYFIGDSTGDDIFLGYATAGTVTVPDSYNLTGWTSLLAESPATQGRQGCDLGGMYVYSGNPGGSYISDFAICTNTGDTLTVDTVASGISANLAAPSVNGPGTRFMTVYPYDAPMTHVLEYDSSGTLLQDWDVTGLGFSSLFHPVREDRVVMCKTGADEVYLYATDGTLIDTLTWGYTAGTWRFLACGPNRVVFVYTTGANPVQFKYRLLDTSGDALSWVAAQVTVPTDWLSFSGAARFSTYDGILTAATTGLGSGYFVNPLTGRSTTVPAFATNGITMVSQSVLVADAVGGGSWYLYPGVPVGGATLRQRQSPKRTPSRVRGVDLRQRQTPYIR